MYGFILDFLLVLCFIVFLVNGFRNGLVRSFLSFVGMAVALILSLHISSMISNAIYSNIIEGILVENVRKSITSGNMDTQAITDRMAGYASGYFSVYGITKDNIIHIISSGTNDAPEKLVRLFAPVVISLMEAVLMTIIFIVLMIAVRIGIKAISGIFRLPVLRQMDGALGAIFGALKGYIFIVIVTFAAGIILPTINNTSGLLSNDTIMSTAIFRHVYDNNPVYRLFKEIGA